MPLYIGFSPHAFDRVDAESGPDGRFTFPAVARGKQTHDKRRAQKDRDWERQKGRLMKNT